MSQPDEQHPTDQPPHGNPDTDGFQTGPTIPVHPGDNLTERLAAEDGRRLIHTETSDLADLKAGVLVEFDADPTTIRDEADAEVDHQQIFDGVNAPRRSAADNSVEQTDEGKPTKIW